MCFLQKSASFLISICASACLELLKSDNAENERKFALSFVVLRPMAEDAFCRVSSSIFPCPAGGLNAEMGRKGFLPLS
eukprot:18492_6